MLDLNITLVFQLVNFFIALYVLNLLLIRPIREIIRKRKAVMANPNPTNTRPNSAFPTMTTS